MMTSTEFSVGMIEGRNSSKVLKPPGGGSSDIFGTKGNDNEPESQKQESSTKDRLFGSDADTQNSSKEDRDKSGAVINDDAKNEAKLNKMKFESVMDAGAKQPKATSIRIRQPPGGKSSGIF